MLGMHLARVQIDPDIKSKGMGNDKKMVLFASSEVRNTYNYDNQLIIHRADSTQKSRKIKNKNSGKNLRLPISLKVLIRWGGGGFIDECIDDYH